MWRQGVLKLISETPGAHGIFDQPTENERMVFCVIRSVGSQEYYRAMENDLHPVLVFRLADYAEYQGEKICEFEDERYRVIRTYCDGQAIELTVEEATVDQAAPDPEPEPTPTPDPDAEEETDDE